MFTSFIGWVKGLSLAGKGVLGVVGVTALGSMSTLGPTPEPVHTDPQVKAEQTVKPPVITTETVSENEPIPYGKETIETGTLEKGVSQITTAGVDGVRTLTYKITKSDGIEIKKEQVSTKVTTAPVTEVTSVGTYVAPISPPAPRNNCDPNYSPCVPMVSYDLDCPDIGYSVTVIGSDPHRFDRDGDGHGCESY